MHLNNIVEIIMSIFYLIFAFDITLFHPRSLGDFFLLQVYFPLWHHLIFLLVWRQHYHLDLLQLFIHHLDQLEMRDPKLK